MLGMTEGVRDGVVLPRNPDWREVAAGDEQQLFDPACEFVQGEAGSGVAFPCEKVCCLAVDC